jgi:hypothetical protein
VNGDAGDVDPAALQIHRQPYTVPRSLRTTLRTNAMGVLTCKLFTDPPSSELENCAIRNSDHIVPGSVGDHVRRIQIALNQLMNIFIGMDGIYGERTVAAVVTFKEAQSPPLRQPGQLKADNIVGIRTINALDKRMFELENKPPAPPSGFISLTPFGTQHDHNKLCTPTFKDSEDFQGRISHLGTPINPQRSGRMICIGGTDEVKYLGFENFVPDPKQDPNMLDSFVNGRSFTNKLPDHCASDICFRSTPLDNFMKVEVKRIARQGCRLTFASNRGAVTSLMTYLITLGPQLQSEVVFDTPPQDPLDFDKGLFVVVFSMLNVQQR